ncbi:MAG: hypothetical protein WCA97_00455 [Terriglobales bacterium]|jgi:hypothetical protein
MSRKRATIASRLETLWCVVLLSLCLACSPRDFLTRRLAADLISDSDTFKTPQLFWLRTGIVSNKDFTSPESLVLQRRGWIIGTEQKCPSGVDPPPCWDVLLTPIGVETVRPLILGALPANGPAIQVARRELVGISGISKAGKFADVEFTWRWIAINQVGAALYDTGVRYRSTVAFRGYDDGWRIVEQTMPSNQTLDESLRNAQPTAP